MKKNIIINTAVIAVCFLYTGSAYMSQYMRLMDFYSDVTVDMITSVYFYILQAAGILLFMIGLRKKPQIFSKKALFVILLIAGLIFMAISQLTSNGTLLAITGCIFNLFIGIYFGFYLTMLSRSVPSKCSGLCLGIAYAIGSIGTYLLSLIKNGDFLLTKEITVVYFILAATTIALVLLSENINCENQVSMSREIISENKINYLIPIVIIMSIISVVGSGLYYSLPTAAHVNWNLIRAFYALGLILAGFIMDKNRLIGEIIAIASLTYPLIATALIDQGVTNTAAMSLSYVFRGFFTIFYFVIFTDISEKNQKYSYLAAFGLFLSRIVEALLSILLIKVALPNIYQLIVSAACFIPLLILFVLMQKKTTEKEPLTNEKRLALFADKYELTAREMEILKCLEEGLSDAEIADKLFISKNTVRFHISNILKKTTSASRVEVVRSLQKF